MPIKIPNALPAAHILEGKISLSWTPTAPTVRISVP